MGQPQPGMSASKNSWITYYLVQHDCVLSFLYTLEHFAHIVSQILGSEKNLGKLLEKEIGKVKSNLNFGAWFLEIICTVTSLKTATSFTKMQCC